MVEEVAGSVDFQGNEDSCMDKKKYRNYGSMLKMEKSVVIVAQNCKDCDSINSASMVIEST